jgi:hypothetical protein
MSTVRVSIKRILPCVLALSVGGGPGCGSAGEAPSPGSAETGARDAEAAGIDAGIVEGDAAAADSTVNGADVASPAVEGGSADSGGVEGDSSAGLADGSSREAGAADGSVGEAGVSSPWKNVAIGGGGFVSGIVFSAVQQDLAYARTDVGGFYRWEGANSLWVPLTDFLPRSQGNIMGGESIAPDPVDANVVYAAGGEYLGSGNGAILRSKDQGNTWTVNDIPVAMGGNANGRGMGERLAVDPNNTTILLFGSRQNGLYKSTNSATSWTPVSTFPTKGDATYGLPVVVFDKTGGTAAGSTNIYVGAASTSAGSNLYKTTDGGATWALVTGAGPTGLMAHHASLGSDGTLWLAYSSTYGPGGGPGNGQVWKYATGTGAWTNVTPPAANWGAMAGGISVDAQNPQHTIVSTLDWYNPDRLLATTNGGASWGVIAQPPVSYNPVGSTYDVNGVEFWLVGGATDVGTGATNWVEAVALDPFNPDHAMYGTGAGVWSSINIQGATGANGQGVTWTFLDKGLEETVPIYLVPTVKGAFLGTIGDLGGMRNTNLDAYSSTGEYSNPVDNNTNGIDFAESNTNFVVRVGNSGKPASDVAYSNDNGVTWTPSATAVPGYATSGQMVSVAVAADGSRFVVSPNSGSAAYTTTNGTSWTLATGLPSGAMLASDRVTATTFYATSGGKLYVSTNGGATFTVANTFAGNGAPRAVFGEAGEVWVAAGGAKLYRFTNSGATIAMVTSLTAAYGVGFGMAAAGQTHPAIYAIGTVGGQYGFFRSDDGAGATWVRINDDAHQYGSLQGNYIAGDENVYGRVYLTTSGRGYVYADVP